jgi:hemerythrin-like metal-binding protein
MTEPLPWNETFSVGHRELDAEHRRMVDLINQICLACDAIQHAQQPLMLLGVLEGVTERHFEHEEAVLEKLYTAMPKGRRRLREMLATAKVEHAAEHRKMLGDLGDMSRALHSDGVAAGLKLCEKLKAWFIDHAVGYEAQIKTILQSA